MRLLADLHIHTVASGHAYSTVLELAKAAADRKLAMIALTDHGPAMPGGPHAYHFSNQFCMPEEIFGVRVLKGIEANIMNRNGDLDLDEKRLAKLDIVLAGLHTFCAPYGTVEENTAMLVQSMHNPWVDVIVHPGNPEYPVDAETVVEAAVEHDIALEINNSSLTVSRSGSEEKCDEFVRLAAKHGAKLVVNSDSHFAASVGVLDAAVALLDKYNIPAEAVLNTSLDAVWAHLKRRTNRR